MERQSTQASTQGYYGTFLLKPYSEYVSNLNQAVVTKNMSHKFQESECNVFLNTGVRETLFTNYRDIVYRIIQRDQMYPLRGFHSHLLCTLW